VFNMEQFDPDPFMDMLNQHGLPWQVKELAGPLCNSDGNQSRRSGAFAHFDLNARRQSLPFVVDRGAAAAEPALCWPTSATAAGIKVLSALKAFSMWKVARRCSGRIS
jgi:hypothetical protein